MQYDTDDAGDWQTVIITGTAQTGEHLLVDGFISAADITSGRLRFVPAENVNAVAGITIFTFQVDDDASGNTLSATADMDIIIVPMDDPSEAGTHDTTPDASVSPPGYANFKRQPFKTPASPLW